VGGDQGMLDSRPQGISPLPIESTGHEMSIKVNPPRHTPAESGVVVGVYSSVQ
jgi:hypothetical protein